MPSNYSHLWFWLHFVSHFHLSRLSPFNKSKRAIIYSLCGQCTWRVARCSFVSDAIERFCWYAGVYVVLYEAIFRILSEDTSIKCRRLYCQVPNAFYLERFFPKIIIPQKSRDTKAHLLRMLTQLFKSSSLEAVFVSNGASGSSYYFLRGGLWFWPSWSGTLLVWFCSLRTSAIGTCRGRSIVGWSRSRLKCFKEDSSNWSYKYD